VAIDKDYLTIFAVTGDVRDIVVVVDSSNATLHGTDHITKNVAVDVLRLMADLAIDLHCNPAAVLAVNLRPFD
jgi:hypothetical protein